MGEYFRLWKKIIFRWGGIWAGLTLTTGNRVEFFVFYLFWVLLGGSAFKNIKNFRGKCLFSDVFSSKQFLCLSSTFWTPQHLYKHTTHSHIHGALGRAPPVLEEVSPRYCDSSWFKNSISELKFGWEGGLNLLPTSPHNHFTFRGKSDFFPLSLTHWERMSCGETSCSVSQTSWISAFLEKRDWWW